LTITSGEAAFRAVEAGAVQRIAELARLLDLVEGRRELLGRAEERLRVLEIGSYRGGTLAGWRTMWPTAYVLAVDLPDPPDQVCAPFGATVLRADSHDPETLAEVLGRTPVIEGRPAMGPPDGFDLVFIDADHELESVALDVAMYGPLVRPSGLLALHDVTPYNADRGGPPMGPELLWRDLEELGPRGVLASIPGALERNERALDLADELEHELGALELRRYAEIIDRVPDREGRGPWWGGIGVAVRA
jgi:hypothetical protein